LNELQAAKAERLGTYLEEGLTIPEPDLEEDNYSGKFVVRIPKSLHRELSERAKQNDISLNQFIISLLASGLALEAHSSALQELRQEIRCLQYRIYDLRYSIDQSLTRSQTLEYSGDYETAA
jgi:CII-binding regulator of phage lambda lysogenization HflD